MNRENLNPLLDAQLGDVVTLPDGTAHSVRARADFSQPVRGMAGFLVLGECRLILGLPPVVGAPVMVLMPGDVPAGAVCRSLVEGATRYWAPHLPSLTGAMGELLWRVLGIAGLPDPAVVLFRGDEVLVYLRTAIALPQHLRLARLDRTDANDVAVVRHTGVVLDGVAPVVDPSELYRTFTPTRSA